MDKNSGIETRSPTPQRRRLSLPETIMRKHSLALERNYYELDCLSDPNLTRKKDYNVIRKSTLLRRLWGDNSKKLSGSFQEWQYSSSQSLNSSPERKLIHQPSSLSTSSCKRQKKNPKKLTKNYTHSESSSDSAYSHSNSTGKKLRETSVQTKDYTNLNIISNISLSQSTLDVIFKEVMKDVNNKLPSGGGITINTATTINLQESFKKTQKKASHNQEIISRFSPALKTSSMDVNISEIDRVESDTASFVDSLEDFSSPRSITTSYMSDVTHQLLPESKNKSSSRKSSAFFVPIKIMTKEPEENTKSVSELLPLRVKERLFERHQKREQKKFYSSSIPSSTSSVNSVINRSSFNIPTRTYLSKKRTKPVLPSIECLKKSSAKSSNNKVNTKIPVVVKSVYLDANSNNGNSSSAVDQLIANMLIDSLNHDAENDLRNANNSNNNNNNGKVFMRNINNSTIPSKSWKKPSAIKSSEEGRKLVKEADEQISKLILKKQDIYTKNTSSSNLGDWSVTISGSNNSGKVPDLEMRLKFPKNNNNFNLNNNNASSSSCDKENVKLFPKIINNDSKRNLAHFTERNKFIQDKDNKVDEDTLPKIQTATEKLKKRENSVLSMSSSVIIPRQTKTSTSRYYFSRPRARYSLPNMPQSILNERKYYEVIQQIPDILSVSGRSISPDRRNFNAKLKK